MTTATPTSLGTKERVISWIWVTDCTTETPKPIARLANRIGAPSLVAKIMVSTAMWMTDWSFTWTPECSSVVARNEGLGDQVPAVDHDEQEQLERQGDHDRGQHHHAHRHQ